jgi:hypothetical protein
MAKVQGEGDYEAARRYNSQTRKFVKGRGAAASHAPGGGIDRAALRKVRSKARDGGQDGRDAKLMAKTERSRKKTAVGRKTH